jgi:hypothetical protein
MVDHDSASGNLEDEAAAHHEPAAVEPCGITVATAKKEALRKGYRLVPGQTEPTKVYSYPERVAKFHFTEYQIASIHELGEVITAAAGDDHAAIIRGRPKCEPLGDYVLNGKRHKGGKRVMTNALRRLKDRANGKATIDETPRRWINLDFDAVLCPEHIDPAHDVDEMLDHLISEHLPEEFEGATCFWQLTASAGIKRIAGQPTINMRLYFWLDRPMGERELKEWMAGRAIDPAVFNAIQLNYLATPEFFGMTDPVPVRFGVRQGHSDAVSVPNIDTIRAEGAERRAASGGGAAASAEPIGDYSLDFQARLSMIGDHEGGYGLHRGALFAAKGYFREHGSGADRGQLRAILEAAIRVADTRKHDAADVESRIGDLARMVDWAAETRAQWESDRATEGAAGVAEGAQRDDPAKAGAAPDLPTLDPFPVPTQSGERAGRNCRRVIKKMFDMAERWLEARDWQRDEREKGKRRIQEAIDAVVDERVARGDELSEDEMTSARRRITAKVNAEIKAEARRKFGKLKKPSFEIKGGAALGKTSACIREYQNRPSLWKRHIWFLELTRDMCKEVAGKFNSGAPEGMPMAKVLHGRQKKGWCDYGADAEKVGPHAPSTFRAMCKNELFTCKSWETCVKAMYLSQFADQSPRVWVLPHQRMFLGMPPGFSLPAPDLVIVDESAVGSLTRTLHVKPECLENPLAYTTKKVSGSEKADKHAEIGTAIAKIIATSKPDGSDIIRRVWAEVGGDPKTLRQRIRAAGLAAKGGRKEGRRTGPWRCRRRRGNRPKNRRNRPAQ